MQSLYELTIHHMVHNQITLVLDQKEKSNEYGGHICTGLLWTSSILKFMCELMKVHKVLAKVWRDWFRSLIFIMHQTRKLHPYIFLHTISFFLAFPNYVSFPWRICRSIFALNLAIVRDVMWNFTDKRTWLQIWWLLFMNLNVHIACCSLFKQFA